MRYAIFNMEEGERRGANVWKLDIEFLKRFLACLLLLRDEVFIYGVVYSTLLIYIPICRALCSIRD